MNSEKSVKELVIVWYTFLEPSLKNDCQSDG